MLGKEIIIYIVSSEFMCLCFTNTKKSLVALLILLRKINLNLRLMKFVLLSSSDLL